MRERFPYQSASIQHRGGSVPGKRRTADPPRHVETKIHDGIQDSGNDGYSTPWPSGLTIPEADSLGIVRSRDRGVAPHEWLSFIGLKGIRWARSWKWSIPALVAVLPAILAVPFVAATPPTIVVRMTEAKSFEPKGIMVKPGDVVVWKNVSSLTHTVTDLASLATEAQDASLPPNAKGFNSGPIPPGKAYSHTFTVPGTYKYFCIPHEEAGMIGTVVVSK